MDRPVGIDHRPTREMVLARIESLRELLKTPNVSEAIFFVQLVDVLELLAQEIRDDA